MNQPIIFWFRQDLRLGDNPGLAAAAAAGPVLPVYILDEVNAGAQAAGGACRWWLHHSLASLNRSLDGHLSVYAGDPLEILPRLVSEHQAGGVYWNRCYEPWRIKRDKRLKRLFSESRVETHSFNGSLLWEPWEVLKNDGTPYRVFTPFYRKGCLGAEPPRTPLEAPRNLELVSDHQNATGIDDLGLLPQVRWDRKLAPHWEIGEAGAGQRLLRFLEHGLDDYKRGRNYPAQDYVSRLSPHLHFGEVSPNQAWHAAAARGDNRDIDTFCTELGWREFCYSLLYRFPGLPTDNWQEKFNAFPWKKSKRDLARWQQGQTGIPFVDAGMRELWQTGYMHNRLRMVVASFLTKNLLLHWRHGERWFRDCLVDADLANNSAGWQWVAGCGADAAPYFRIFNPVTQGQKFDPDGDYTRKYVPELARLPDKYLFSPWEAPAGVLAEAGVEPGETYPRPMVDLRASRERALLAYRGLAR